MKRHVLSMREFSRDEIDSVLDLAVSLEPYARGKKSNMLEGKILALLFFEPSTRTRMSFETAMKRLGGSVINLGPAGGVIHLQGRIAGRHSAGHWQLR